MPLYGRDVKIYKGHSLSEVQLAALPKEISTLSFSSSVNKQGKQRNKLAKTKVQLCTVTFSCALSSLLSLGGLPVKRKGSQANQACLSSAPIETHSRLEYRSREGRGMLCKLTLCWHVKYTSNSAALLIGTELNASLIWLYRPYKKGKLWWNQDSFIKIIKISQRRLVSKSLKGINVAIGVAETTCSYVIRRRGKAGCPYL